MIALRRRGRCRVCDPPEAEHLTSEMLSYLRMQSECQWHSDLYAQGRTGNFAPSRYAARTCGNISLTDQTATADCSPEDAPEAPDDPSDHRLSVLCPCGS